MANSVKAEVSMTFKESLKHGVDLPIDEVFTRVVKDLEFDELGNCCYG